MATTQSGVEIPNIPTEFKVNENLDRSREEISIMIDDIMDKLRNMSENAASIKGQFGNSVNMTIDDFLGRTNGLSFFTRESFSPAINEIKEYENYLDIIKNYDENKYNENVKKIEDHNAQVANLTVDDANVNHTKIVSSDTEYLRNTAMTLEDFIEALPSMKNRINQLGEHDIVDMPIGDQSGLYTTIRTDESETILVNDTVTGEDGDHAEEIVL